MKKLIGSIGTFGQALLLVLFLPVVGLFFLGPIGALIGLVLGLILASGAIQEKLNPEKYKLHEGACPHCGSPIKWRLPNISRNGFNCPTCKSRIVLIDNKPLTPAQAKEVQNRV